MKAQLTSWVTTLCGIGAILVAIGSAIMAIFDQDPNTHVNWELLAGLITAGGVGIAARDANKSSQQSGIRK